MAFSTVWFRRENKRDRKWGGKWEQVLKTTHVA